MDIDDRIRAYAADAVGDCSADRITAVTRFESGENHAVYKVSYVDPDGRAEDVVVRISSSHEVAACAVAEREARVLQKVQELAGPLLYDFRGDSPWFDAPTTCTQFVRGQQREMAASAQGDIERLGTVVGALHGLPIDDLVEWFPATDLDATYLDARLEVIVRKLPSIRDPLPGSLQRRLDRAWRLVNESLERARSAESFAGDEALALLHGDVAAGNIIWGDADPVLIDWEYARLGDPADEIAYIFGQNGLAEAQRNAFWRGYRQGSQPQRRLQHVLDRVGWWEPMNLLGSVLWWVERWSRRADADAAGDVDPFTPKTQSYYLDQAVRRLDRLEQLIDGRADGQVL